MAAWLRVIVIAACAMVPALAQDAAGSAPFAAAGPISIAAVLALMALAALFAAAEAAYLAPRKLRLEHMEKEGSLSGRYVARLGAQQGPLLAAILVAHISVLVLFALIAPALLAAFVRDVLVLSEAGALAIGLVVSPIVLVLFCEAIPRVIASRHREATARALALPLQAIVWTLSPIAALLIRFTDVLFRLMGLGKVRAAPFLTDEELKTAVAAHETRGVIEEQEGQMIQGILSFGDAQLREILVPRPDIVAVPEDITVRQALGVYREEGYSRMPVYQEDLDHVTGTLVAKDLLGCITKEEWERPIREIMRAPRFVPETMTALGFVRDAQRMQMHLAIVVDEYGGTAGIVTLEDAIEQVVGEIPDEDEEKRELVVSLGDSRYRIDGGLPLKELSSLLGVPVNDEEHETVGGLLMDLTNKIPEKGDQSEYYGARFTVEEVDGKRVSSLTVEVLPPPAAQEQAG
jgi:CBS domain containing-hemolysin-like protein